MVSPFLTRFGPVAVTPALVSTLADPVVSCHTLASPAAFLMAICSAPCGFVNANFCTTPVARSTLFKSYTPAREWCATNGLAAISPNKTTATKVRLFTSASESIGRIRTGYSPECTSGFPADLLLRRLASGRRNERRGAGMNEKSGDDGRASLDAG